MANGCQEYRDDLNYQEQSSSLRSLHETSVAGVICSVVTAKSTEGASKSSLLTQTRLMKIITQTILLLPHLRLNPIFPVSGCQAPGSAEHCNTCPYHPCRHPAFTVLRPRTR